MISSKYLCAVYQANSAEHHCTEAAKVNPCHTVILQLQNEQNELAITCQSLQRRRESFYYLSLVTINHPKTFQTGEGARSALDRGQQLRDGGRP